MPHLSRAHVEEASWRPCQRYAFCHAHLPHPHLALPIQRIDRHDGDDRQDDQAQHPDLLTIPAPSGRAALDAAESRFMIAIIEQVFGIVKRRLLLRLSGEGPGAGNGAVPSKPLLALAHAACRPRPCSRAAITACIWSVEAQR